MDATVYELIKNKLPLMKMCRSKMAQVSQEQRNFRMTIPQYVSSKSFVCNFNFIIYLRETESGCVSKKALASAASLSK